MDPTEPLRQLELQRWQQREQKDLEVESARGPRPLEGWSSGGHTTWMGDQDDDSAPREHGDDERSAREASQEQVDEAGEATRR